MKEKRYLIGVLVCLGIAIGGLVTALVVVVNQANIANQKLDCATTADYSSQSVCFGLLYKKGDEGSFEAVYNEALDKALDSEDFERTINLMVTKTKLLVGDGKCDKVSTIVNDGRNDKIPANTLYIFYSNIFDDEISECNSDSLDDEVIAKMEDLEASGKLTLGGNEQAGTWTDEDEALEEGSADD